MRAAIVRSTVLVALVLALSSAAVASSASALTLDAFTEPFPPNPCLPNSDGPVIFIGPYCDGLSCPPDPWATCIQDQALQTGLPGVHGGRREVRVIEWAGSGTLTARVDPGSGSLVARFDVTAEAGVNLAYGTPYVWTQDPDALNLDLVALGASGFEFPVEGTFSPGQPLFVAITLLADAPGLPPRPSATATRVVADPGPVLVALEEFVAQPGFTMSDVDDIEIWLSNCTDFDQGCTDAEYAPFDVRLGPVSIATGPTPTAATSWGRVKASYR
jgi:hypothetical protein